jgi:hypothetical protein
MADRAKRPADPPTPETERRQGTKKRVVLSRKARERSALLKKASRDLIDASRELIAQSHERDKKPR